MIGQIKLCRNKLGKTQIHQSFVVGRILVSTFLISFAVELFKIYWAHIRTQYVSYWSASYCKYSDNSAEKKPVPNRIMDVSKGLCLKLSFDKWEPTIFPVLQWMMLATFSTRWRWTSHRAENLLDKDNNNKNFQLVINQLF